MNCDVFELAGTVNVIEFPCPVAKEARPSLMRSMSHLKFWPEPVAVTTYPGEKVLPVVGESRKTAGDCDVRAGN